MPKDYKGTIIKESLIDPSILDSLQIVSDHVENSQDDADGSWHLYTVLISRDEIPKIQPYLERKGGWYMHFWKGRDVIVVFRDRVFEIDADDKTTWKDAVEYGLSMGVPAEQLDFLAE